MKKIILTLLCIFGISVAFSVKAKAASNPPSILYFYIYSSSGQEYFGKYWPEATNISEAFAMDQNAKNDNLTNMRLFEASEDLKLRIMLNRTVPVDTPIYLYLRFNDYRSTGGVDTRAAVDLPDSILIPSGVTLFEYPYRIKHLPDAQHGGLARMTGYTTRPDGSDYSSYSDRVNFYNRFVYDIQFYKTAPQQGNVRIKIKYGTKDLVCSFDDGLTWQSALEKEYPNVDIPNGIIYIKEPNSPHLAEININDFIADGWGTFTVYHSVNIPDVRNASINLHAGIHYIQSNKDFRFILTPTGENEGLIPHITTNRTDIPDTEGVEIMENEDGSFTVDILKVQQAIDLFINWQTTTSARSYSIYSAHVWSNNGTLYIKSPANGTAYIYDAAGKLAKMIAVSENETMSANLSKGFYVVKIGVNTYKILIY